MTDRINIEIVSSGGKECLSIGDNIVAGPWTGQGRTLKTFAVSLADLERIIAEHKAQEPTMTSDNRSDLEALALRLEAPDTNDTDCLAAAEMLRTRAARLQPARVPEEVNEWAGENKKHMRGDYAYAAGWNDCRDAMLAAPAPEADAKGGGRRFRGVAELERTGYIPSGSAAERESAHPAPEPAEAVKQGEGREGVGDA